MVLLVSRECAATTTYATDTLHENRKKESQKATRKPENQRGRHHVWQRKQGVDYVTSQILYGCSADIVWQRAFMDNDFVWVGAKAAI
jgi:hypothetical protein